MGRILKAHEVNLDGTFLVEVQQTGSGQTDPGIANSIQARIVDTQPTFAIIEVNCSCGTRANIRCEFAQKATP